jgi:hypothetical protein
MTLPRARIRPVTAILVFAILVLGVLATARERREARLRSALAKFQNRAHQEIYSSLNNPVSAPGTSAAVPLNWGGSSSLQPVIDEITTLITSPRFLKGAPRALAVDIDSAGLLEAGHTPKSVALLPAAPTSDIPASDLIRQLLKPFDLAFKVQEGKLTITSRKALERSHENIIKQLDQPVKLTWSRRDSLRDVIERLRMETRGANHPEGLPIFAQLGGPRSPDHLLILPDPPPEALPLREQLQRLLEPLGLRYEIRDGALMVVTKSDEHEPA